jgi:hypothetical protein
MRPQILHQLDYTGELLQYFTGSITTTTATKTYAASSIQAGLSVGDKVFFAGFSNADSNGIKTIATLGTNELTVSETIGTGESGVTATLSQEYQGAWVNVDSWAALTGTINTSGAAIIYIDQSGDKTNVDYTSTWAVTAATALSYSVETIAKYGRMRVRTNAADQTIMRAYLFGRSVS